MKKRKLSKQEAYQKFIEAEFLYNKDRIDEVIRANRKLRMSPSGQEALLWLIRFLVRTHPDPMEILDHTANLLEVFDKEWDLIATILESELVKRENDIAKNEDRK